jgi:serine/threonine protein kinase
MRKKHPVPFTQKFRNADPLALRLLERLLAFDPKDRPTAEEVNSEHSFFSFVGTALTISTKNASHIFQYNFIILIYFNLISGSG